MKKVVLFFCIIIAIVSSFSYVYLNHVATYKTAQKENAKFEMYKDEEILGSELTTIINRVIDNNKKNDVQIGDDGKYINNNNNSINVDIKFIDDDVIYNIEKIYNSKMENFLYYYRNITFKCSEIQYHNSTKKVKYMLFEQITQ